MTNYDRFFRLTTDEIEPKGWILQQLKIQAKGLSGNLQNVWPDVRDSQWIGGNKEGWERVPYWLDGFVPMAYLLKDKELIAVAEKYINFIISKQEENPDNLMLDGWICPCKDELEQEHFDEWAVILICKALIVYYNCSKDERIPDVVYKILSNLKWRLEHFAIKSWGSYRWFEALIPIYWLYDRTGETWLITMAHNLYEQGADYNKIFHNWRDQKPHSDWRLSTHVVNLAMALKSEALAARFLNAEGADIDPNEFAHKMLSLLQEYHGNVLGYFNGDECISGTSPTRGTELCGVVEAMYSYEWLFAITGDSSWIDYLERLAFNALPAGLSQDMWARQYDQMANQIACPKYKGPDRPFMTNGVEAGQFGLEPHYGCCTANFSQGWPKFILSTFMRSKTGLASVAHAPAKCTLDINGAKVTADLDTMYPFRNTLTYTITTDKPVDFDFEIVIPSCLNAAVVDGKKVNTGEIYKISRRWEGTIVINAVFDFKTEFIKRPNDLVALCNGPLIFSLPIKEEWTKMEFERDGIERKFPYCDYEVMPRSEWQYAYSDTDVTFEENDNYDIPFSTLNPPICAYANMHTIDWGYDPEFEGLVAARVPNNRKATSKTERIRLIPYGAAKLRMTEMPLDKPGK